MSSLVEVRGAVAGRLLGRVSTGPNDLPMERIGDTIEASTREIVFSVQP
jgi:hypothetical protein